MQKHQLLANSEIPTAAQSLKPCLKYCQIIEKIQDHIEEGNCSGDVTVSLSGNPGLIWSWYRRESNSSRRTSAWNYDKGTFSYDPRFSEIKTMARSPRCLINGYDLMSVLLNDSRDLFDVVGVLLVEHEGQPTIYLELSYISTLSGIDETH